VQTVPKNPDSCLPPKAIAARVGDRNLWIDNVGAIKPQLLAEIELDPEYIVTVNETATAATTDHYPLKNEHVNDHQKFSVVVGTTRAHIRSEGTVLVNCSVGLSRSASVIATAIAAEDGLSFDAAVAEIRDHRLRANPHPKLQLNAYAYLVTEENRADARHQIDAIVDNIHLRSETGNAIQELVSEESNDQTPS
jgi:atypical dual specificity phosphatase